MDIRELNCFIAIAEEGSLSAASQRLGVAQPSLPQHVVKIEQELGVTLMHRSPTGVTITNSGEILPRQKLRPADRAGACCRPASR